jgi:hypothetical protein
MLNREDSITLRGTNRNLATEDGNASITITPYSKMYINLHDGTNYYYTEKHEAGEEVTI